MKRNPKTIQVGDIEIHENGAENETATIKLHIPIRVSLCGRREMSEYKSIALDDLRGKASVLFGLMEYVGEELGSGGYDGVAFADIILLSGQIGNGLMEAAKSAQEYFDSSTPIIESEVSE